MDNETVLKWVILLIVLAILGGIIITIFNIFSVPKEYSVDDLASFEVAIERQELSICYEINNSKLREECFQRVHNEQNTKKLRELI